MIPAKTRQAVLERDGWTCQVCGRSLFGEYRCNYSLQHRRARAMGGSRRPDTNTAANLITVCGSATTGCHQRIESNPRWAAEHGLRLTQRQTPAEEPVFTVDGWRFLLDDGTWLPALRCYRQGWHPAHTWTYGGQAVRCDGLTFAEPGEEPERPCCADPLCPCKTKPGWTGIATGSMDYPDLEF